MKIIYIDIDSARADHFGCYGYSRQTTPHIDSLAAEGVCFDNFYAADTPCLPSRTGTFTGCLGIHTGVVNHGGTNADLPVQGGSRMFRNQWARDALGQRLRDAGYYCGSITPFPQRHSGYQLWYGFHETFDTGKSGMETADEVYPYVDRWLEANAHRERAFLHVNFWDPHDPYNTPLDYGEPFAQDPPPEWLTQKIIDQQRASYGYHDPVCPWGGGSYGAGQRFNWIRGCDTIRNRDDWKTWINGYDTGLHYTDFHVGKMIEKLKELGQWEQTAIVVSADHGEGQGELEVYGDHHTADEATNRIPLIVRWPGVTDTAPGKRVGGFFYNVDLSATFVDLAGGEIPERWDGRSFAAVLRNEDSGAEGRPYLILQHGAWSVQRAIRWSDYLLIRTYHTGHKNFPPLMLFDLKNDPHETHNLAPDHPELVAEGLLKMDDWVSEHLQKHNRPDPLFQTIAEGGPYHARNPRDLCKYLRETGRPHHADWLEKNGGKPRS